MVLCAVWLSLDVGIWISEAKLEKRAKVTYFCSVATILCCFSMAVMYLFLSSALEDQRADVYQHLEVSHSTPSGHSNDPMFEMFSIANRGSFDISKKHGITCYVQLAIGNNRSSKISGVWLTLHGDKATMGALLDPTVLRLLLFSEAVEIPKVTHV